jgi:polysaccharide export outer membrane protein
MLMKRLLSAAALAALASLSFGLPAAAQGADVKVSLEGKPGEVRCFASVPLSLHSERSGNDLKLVIACTAVSKITPGLESVVKPVPGGVAIDVPLAANPTYVWQASGVNIRWTTTGGTSASQELFASTTPPAYPLGPGDKLQVIVYNVEDMNQTVTVDPNGIITFPVLDKVSVKGLTVNQLQQHLEELLTQFVKNPQVNIQLLEYGSRYVNVLGEVTTPGRIPLKGTYRVLDAISQAGGFNERSGDVEIERRDESGVLQSKVFTREELLAGSSEKYNIYVKDQDVINVQTVKSVYVTGEVAKPGSFPYQKDMTFLRAVTLAGGFGQWANKGRVDILREEKSGRTILHVDAGKIEKGKAEDVPLMPNDQIVVRERKFF